MATGPNGHIGKDIHRLFGTLAIEPFGDLNMAYGPKIIDHYENPRNVGSFGTQAEIKQRKDVGVGLVGAPECGDVMKLQIEIDQATSVFTDA